MEYCKNGDLFDFLKFINADICVIKYYFRQLVLGLKYIHGIGYVHRDIKLENLLVHENFDLKIGDFGFLEERLTEQNINNF